jgi:hypothetical protein
MTAEELLYELLALRDLYGSLKDIPVTVFLGHDRLDITLVDYFTENHEGKEILHSIDLNARYYDGE